MTGGSPIYQRPNFQTYDQDIRARSFVKLRVASGYDFHVTQATAGDLAIGIAQKGTLQPSGVLGANTTLAAIGTGTQAGIQKIQQVQVWMAGDEATLQMSTTCATGDDIWPDSNGYGTNVPQGGPPSAKALEACPESGVSIQVVVLPMTSDSMGTLTKTADYTVVAADLGKTILVNGADLSFTLPAAAGVAGKKITFQNIATTATYTGGSVGTLVKPASGESVKGSVITTPASDKGVVNTYGTAKNGDLVELTSYGSAGWYVTRTTGTWTRQS